MSRLARNIGYNVSGQLVLLVLGLTSARAIYGDLGKDVLGIVYFAMMLNAIVVAILELGVTTTTVKEVAASHEKDPAYVRSLIRTGAAMYWAGYALAAVAVYVAAPLFVEKWIHLEQLAPDAAISLLRILGCSTLLALPQTFYVSVFRGLQRMGLTNALDIAAATIQQVGILVVISLTGDPTWVAVWIAGVAIVRVALLMAFVGGVFGAGALVPRVDRAIVRRNRGFALPMLAITILAMVHTQADDLVISWLLPVGGIGVFGLIYGTAARGSLVTNAVAQGAFPALSELAHAGDRDGLLRTYHRLHDLLCYGLVPLYAALAFAALPMFGAVFGAARAASLVVPTALLALGFYLNGTLTIPYFVCLASERPDIAARQNVVALFTTLPVTIVLTWQLGLAGAAGAWVWYQLFAYVYSMPRVCREVLDLAPRRWFAHVARILAVAAGTYGAAAIAVVVVGTSSIAVLATAYLVATLGFAAVSWRVLGADSRSSFVAVLRRLRRPA